MKMKNETYEMHTHLEYGYAENCPGCETTKEDFSRSLIQDADPAVTRKIAGEQAERWAGTLAILAAS